MQGSPPLTRRELEVLRAVGRRLTNPEIAAELVVSLRTVESHVAALRRKLGVDSRAALRAAAGRLGPGPSEAEPRSPWRLVAPEDDFVGRDAELATVRAMLAGHRLVTVTGTVGCGKSRLALEAVAGRRGLVLDVDLAGPDLALALATALGVQASADDAVDAAALALDAGCDVLLLDNCDPRQEETLRLARALLPRTTRPVVLCTSRGPLGTPEEVVLPVAPLSGDTARTRAAVDLFLARATAAGARGEDLDPGVVERICGHLDGLPLALELAAVRCSGIPPAALESLLARGLQPLGRLTAHADRHRTLADAVDWSVRMLDDATRHDLVRLCSLPAPVPLGDVEDVLGEGRLRRVLELVDRSLAWSGRTTDGHVVGVLRTVREQVLATAPEDAVAAARDAWCRHVERSTARLAERAVRDDGPPVHRAWRALVGGLPWVVARLAAGGPARAATLAGDVGVLTEQLGPDAATSAAVAAFADDPAAADTVPLDRVDLVGDALLFGHVGTAARLARRAARRSPATPAERAAVARLVGTVAVQEGRVEDAVDALGTAATLSEAGGDGRRRALALHGLAMAVADGPEPQDAWPLFERAMAQYAAEGDAMHVNNVRYMLCHHAVVTGSRVEEALGWAGQCVDYATETDNVHELAHALLVRAELAAAVRPTGTGGDASVRADLERARTVFADLGDARCLARALLALADQASGGDRPALLQEAWSAAVRARKRGLMTRAAGALVQTLHEAGRTREAGLVLGALAAAVDEDAALAAAPHDPDGAVDWTTLVAEGAARARRPGGPVGGHPDA